MQNKPNFRNDKMNITLDMTSNYRILIAGSGQKINPIQTQLKPKQTQFNPIQSQFKPNNQLSLIDNHLEEALSQNFNGMANSASADMFNLQAVHLGTTGCIDNIVFGCIIILYSGCVGHSVVLCQKRLFLSCETISHFHICIA